MVEEAIAALEHVGLQVIVRPAYTLGGTGGGIAFNRHDFVSLCRTGIEASPARQILFDESLLGRKEFEMKFVRDKVDTATIVCPIENVDPMGVHAGDSVTVAPSLTQTDKEYKRMRNGSLAVLREFALVKNTTEGRQTVSDSRRIRMAAIADRIPYCTNAAAIHAIAGAPQTWREREYSVLTFQSFSSWQDDFMNAPA